MVELLILAAAAAMLLLLRLAPLASFLLPIIILIPIIIMR
jgi:hypothetical protein